MKTINHDNRPQSVIITDGVSVAQVVKQVGGSIPVWSSLRAKYPWAGPCCSPMHPRMDLRSFQPRTDSVFSLFSWQTHFGCCPSDGFWTMAIRREGCFGEQQIKYEIKNSYWKPSKALAANLEEQNRLAFISTWTERDAWCEDGGSDRQEAEQDGREPIRWS